MSYVLLWIEVLVTALLWSAMFQAIARATTSGAVRRLGAVIGWMLPVITFGAALCLCGYLKLEMGITPNYLVPVAILVAAWLVGAVMIRHWMRRHPAGAVLARGRLAGALVAAIAVTAMTFWNMDLAVRAQASSLRVRAGAMMVSLSPPMIPDSQNAAIVYEQAFARLKADAALKDPDNGINAATPDVSSAAVQDTLRRHAVTIALVHRGAAMADCRFDHDYAQPAVAMPLPELWQARLSVRLLRVHALAEVAAGRVDSAVGDVVAMQRLSQHIGRDPLLVSKLVASAMEAMALETLMDVLPAVTRAESLGKLELPAESVMSNRAMMRMYRGEMAIGLSIFDDVASGTMSLPELARIVGAPGPAPAASGPAAVVYRVFFLAADVRAYQELLGRYQDMLSRPYYEVRDKLALAEIRPRGNHRDGMLTSVLAPSLGRMIERGAQAQALRSAADLAIAATRYRLDHDGAAPATLEVLVPAYLGAIPTDPFSGQPLKIAAKADELRFYSVGPDLKDNGGEPLDRARNSGDVALRMSVAQPGKH